MKIRVHAEDEAELQTQADQIAEVDAFVRRHFTWPGTLRLHGAALGRDILKAPVNVLLSPVLVLVRVVGWLCGRLGLRSASVRLLRQNILLRTTVAARVEAAILSELLGAPLPDIGRPLGRAELRHALVAAPRFREALRSRGTLSDVEPVANRIMDAVTEYAGTRSAIAEVTAALVALAVGAIAFQSLTPGMISMAPGVAEAVSRNAAISDFPLGATLGGVWYGVFPLGPSPALVAATILGLVLLGSVVAAFAGILADPVQARIGMHRRRLIRLLATLESELGGGPTAPFVAREHFFARIFDLSDAALSVIRVFRN